MIKFTDNEERARRKVVISFVGDISDTCYVESLFPSDELVEYFNNWPCPVEKPVMSVKVFNRVGKNWKLGASKLFLND